MKRLLYIVLTVCIFTGSVSALSVPSQAPEKEEEQISHSGGAEESEGASFWWYVLAAVGGLYVGAEYIDIDADGESGHQD